MKEYIVNFSPMALDDIRQAIAYYEDLQKGLGAKFNERLLATLTAIRRNALFASVRYDDIRCAQIKKFPYMVHYHVNNEKEVTVVSVYSSYKQPLWGS
jgi:toxin ParE1/3/4